MRVRLRVLLAGGLCAVVPLVGGCTSSGHPGSSTSSSSRPNSSTGQVLPTSSTSPHAISAYCAKLQAAGTAIAKAEVQLYTAGGGATNALNALETELDALKSGAPPAVRTAVDDLASAFRTASELLAHPTEANKSQLASVGAKLAADGQKLTAYVTAQC